MTGLALTDLRHADQWGDHAQAGRPAFFYETWRSQSAQLVGVS